MKTLKTVLITVLLAVPLLVFADAGSLDTTFNPGAGANGDVQSIVVQPDGKIIIAGAFSTYDGISRGRVARLHTDGSLDTTFANGQGGNGVIYSMALQPDGKVLIGGGFSAYDGIARGNIARLNTDGSLDTTFDPGSGASSTIRSVIVQPDGKILIGGFFTDYNGSSRSRIARLNANGTLDHTFAPGTGANNVILAMILQSDGKIVIAGGFNFYNGTFRSRIARINADGTLDPSFDPGSGANFFIFAVTFQPDGKIFIGGTFSSYNGQTRRGLARLNIDGTLDASFNPGTGVNGARAIALQPDWKILITGTFTFYGSTPRNRIARVNQDGALDTTFNPGSGADSSVWALAIQPDMKALIGGTFSSYDGVGRNKIARINLEGTQSIFCDSQNENINVCISGKTHCLPLHAANTILQTNSKATVGECVQSQNKRDITTGMHEESTTSGISVFPNPSTGLITIATTRDTGLGRIRIVNAQGKVDLERSVQGNQTELDLTNMPAGLYFIRIEHISETLKVVKR